MSTDAGSGKTEAPPEAGGSPPAAPQRSDTDNAPLRPALDADGTERPAFLLDFPEDPDLERLITAFERGNYALVRREAEPLAARTADAEVRRAALELRRRIEPDPLAKTLLFVSVLLLVFLSLWAYLAH